MSKPTSTGSFVAARSNQLGVNAYGTWYVYRSFFNVAEFIGRTDCLAFETEKEARDAAKDAELRVR